MSRERQFLKFIFTEALVVSAIATGVSLWVDLKLAPDDNLMRAVTLGVLGLAAYLDYKSTLAILDEGGVEVNPWLPSRPDKRQLSRSVRLNFAVSSPFLLVYWPIGMVVGVGRMYTAARNFWDAGRMRGQRF
ncbi:hypothetical protein A3H89_05335 [Candidatus Amesbacteria bacterium RIFCSPLOWO2_02_FULL_48_11]|uniref:Uncharacterized protein n=3 Tax=Candidatus Amesiibacteriota TaxID=1752730 RepID=A0A1F4Z4W0_9BACT|nr:MAG: hypothetical protein UX78_C0012G0003 [Candidatus Amesbacteria bacterium GW2011_GWA2_47_11]KKW00400.1 MAG: hypothetical protein UY33_C0011G0004 [Candidatus Amesbacteria bacterium GW2011_GWA1_48_9]OGC90601.1 MAG: hypothetical protein A2V48_01595 [Candidatus Amesbacteria bacterium RBG_19FT_COMBO_48_16]OGC97343.1 MAG: hypothetical protein A3C34_03140 [Candidatus Amesbacteria bacterium RIFCSPHIGHO2_02_FULL_48_21]OGC98678.1 MAG: hypothetical protein A2702_01980 [Candidatus Amesbacteria bacter